MLEGDEMGSLYRIGRESPYHQLKRQYGGSRKKRVACTSWYRMVKVVAGLEQYLHQVIGGTGRVEVMVSYS